MRTIEMEVRFRCPNCDELIHEALSGTSVHTFEGGVEVDLTGKEEVTCQNCGNAFMLDVLANGAGFRASLQDVPETSVYLTTLDIPDVDEEVDFLTDIPSDPAIEIEMTLEDVRAAISEAEPSFHYPTLQRMAFVQQCAAMEAYLADRLIGRVRSDPAAFARMLSHNTDLKTQRFSLSEVHANTQIVQEKVVSHLLSVSYNNLPKVAALYLAATEVRLFPNDATKTRLMTVMSIRHDCVHRNGRTKDGATRNEIDDGFLWQMEFDLLALVKHVECQLLAKDASNRDEPL